MVGAARKRASYADVLAAPPELVAELLDGELHLQPRPAAAHAAARQHGFKDIDSATLASRG